VFSFKMNKIIFDILITFRKRVQDCIITQKDDVVQICVNNNGKSLFVSSTAGMPAKQAPS